VAYLGKTGIQGFLAERNTREECGIILHQFPNYCLRALGIIENLVWIAFRVIPIAGSDPVTILKHADMLSSRKCRSNR
jgi:hypothetical protein